MVEDNIIEDDFAIYEKEPDVAEEIEVKKPEQVPKQKQDEGKYDSVIDEQPELKQYLEYIRLKKKAADGQPLTKEETEFKNAIELAVQREQEAKQTQEEQLKIEAILQKEKDEEIRKQYLKTKEKSPEKIVKAKEKEIVLTGGESIPKILKLVFAMRKARKKGGKVLVQVFRSRKVLIRWTKNDVTFVEFYTKDEKGNELMEITRFSEYPYSFEGTPIPVLFAVQGYAEGFDFFSEFRKDLSSEMVSRLTTRAFHAGYLKGAEVAQPGKKVGVLQNLQALTPLILIAGFVILGFLMYQMYNDNTAVLNAVNALQSRISDVNALILR